MTQKQLGEILGFLGKTSDVRMAQYESEARVPVQQFINCDLVLIKTPVVPG